MGNSEQFAVKAMEIPIHSGKYVRFNIPVGRGAYGIVCNLGCRIQRRRICSWVDKGFCEDSEITEFKTPPEDTEPLEEKKPGVKGMGRKKTDETTLCLEI